MNAAPGLWIDLRESARAVMPKLPAAGRGSELAAHARATWRGRMVNEHGSARVFETLAQRLDAAGLEGGDVCRGFAEEERRHGVLCGAVLEALGGEATFFERPCDYPDHGVSPRLAVTLDVLSICCLSETVAVALVGAERLAMESGELRDLLESILADEIGHARFGWRFLACILPTLTSEERGIVEAYLPEALEALEAHNLANISPVASPSADAPALGVCDGNDMRSLLYSTMREVIEPRLAELGLGLNSRS
ncbi:MAG: ferritin-like domain-containing protein [Polyangiaceae bacterium]